MQPVFQAVCNHLKMILFFVMAGLVRLVPAMTSFAVEPYFIGCFFSQPQGCCAARQRHRRARRQKSCRAWDQNPTTECCYFFSSSRTSSAWRVTPVLSKIFDKWLRAVPTVMPSRSAVACLPSPLAISSAKVASAGVNPNRSRDPLAPHLSEDRRQPTIRTRSFAAGARAAVGRPVSVNGRSGRPYGPAGDVLPDGRTPKN